MSNNEDYNPFSNIHNPNNAADSSQRSAGSAAPFYSSTPADPGANPYMTPTEPPPYGPPAGEHNYYGQPVASPAPFQGQNPGSPLSHSGNPYGSAGSPSPSEGSSYGSAGNPYAPSGSAPAYQGPLNTPGYQYGGYGYNAGNMSQGANSNATAALILGILGLTLLPFIGSILAVVLGFSAKKQIRSSGQEGSGAATAGLVMGWIGLGLSFFGLLFTIVIFMNVAG